MTNKILEDAQNLERDQGLRQAPNVMLAAIEHSPR